ncbi:MAG: hypothetical protein E7459_08845 [Ruminococcaceae bacterium]|nr:hypothetical protein [Oscillospiraceae bacterium]
MTIMEAITHFDHLTHNQISVPVKVVWLSGLDGLVHREILSTHKGAGPAAFSGYSADTDTDTRLLIPHPYDEIYRWYLEMKTWDTLGEMDRYNNAAQKYNMALLTYMDYINRNFTPIGVGSLRLV